MYIYIYIYIYTYIYIYIYTYVYVYTYIYTFIKEIRRLCEGMPRQKILLYVDLRLHFFGPKRLQKTVQTRRKGPNK